VHTFYSKPIQIFKLRAYCRGVEGGVSYLLIELEELWEEAAGEEVLF